jgi:hypothetical protein
VSVELVVQVVIVRVSCTSSYKRVRRVSGLVELVELEGLIRLQRSVRLVRYAPGHSQCVVERLVRLSNPLRLPACRRWCNRLFCLCGAIACFVCVVLSPVLFVWCYRLFCLCGAIAYFVSVVLSPVLFMWCYRLFCLCEN